MKEIILKRADGGNPRIKGLNTALHFFFKDSHIGFHLSDSDERVAVGENPGAGVLI